MATINDFIAQLVGQGAQQVAANAPAIAQGAGQAVVNASNNTPSIMGILSSLVANQGVGQTQAGFQPQTPALDNGAGFGVMPKKGQKMQLSPAQEAIKDVVYDKIYEEGAKHIGSGGSAQQLEEHFGLAPAHTAPAQPANPGSQPVTRDEVLSFLSDFAKQQGGQQPQAAPQQGQILPASSFFGGGGVDSNFNVTQPGLGRQIIGAIAPVFGPGASVSENVEKAGKMMDNQLKLQKLQGNEPLQAGEREKEMLQAQIASNKLNLERRDKFFEGINQPLTTTKELSFVESALTGIDNVSNLLGITQDPKTGVVSVTNKDLLRSKNFLSKNRQQLKRARDAFINKSLRRDTGATIGEKEEKEFQKTFGFDIGINAFMQNPDVIAKSLIESKDQLMRDRGRLSPNEETRNLVAQLSGRYSKAEIYDYLTRTGRA
jgi:hypothetical protein